ncbi:expressed protein isoform B [Micractinium conductrix]|uniref:Expressed protein isoform A n=1 Tax=Micractinium conductrix TaxID=554055 RepID=A0A2P6VPP0_9CHLO|nr:expressed protein isoform A [Micractinium conductrix]PSC76050.1 expressed protein isoform B [Micractinium conductrix]|eukprot:PSC76049.1 expressed protein isoform A [Micractinium conductrix]
MRTKRKANAQLEEEQRQPQQPGRHGSGGGGDAPAEPWPAGQQRLPAMPQQQPQPGGRGGGGGDALAATRQEQLARLLGLETRQEQLARLLSPETRQEQLARLLSPETRQEQVARLLSPETRLQLLARLLSPETLARLPDQQPRQRGGHGGPLPLPGLKMANFALPLGDLEARQQEVPVPAPLPLGPSGLRLQLDLGSVMTAWGSVGGGAHPFQTRGTALVAAAASIPLTADLHATLAAAAQPSGAALPPPDAEAEARRAKEAAAAVARARDAARRAAQRKAEAPHAATAVPASPPAQPPPAAAAPAREQRATRTNAVVAQALRQLAQEEAQEEEAALEAATAVGPWRRQIAVAANAATHLRRPRRCGECTNCFSTREACLQPLQAPLALALDAFAAQARRQQEQEALAAAQAAALDVAPPAGSPAGGPPAASAASAAAGRVRRQQEQQALRQQTEAALAEAKAALLRGQHARLPYPQLVQLEHAADWVRSLHEMLLRAQLCFRYTRAAQLAQQLLAEHGRHQALRQQAEQACQAVAATVEAQQLAQAQAQQLQQLAHAQQQQLAHAQQQQLAQAVAAALEVQQQQAWHGLSQPSGVVHFGLFERPTLPNGYPLTTEAIVLQSGRGGAPLAPPPGFTKVAGAELAVRISELFRPLVTGEVRNLEGLLRLPGASEAEPGAPAGRLGFHSDGDGVQWITQRLGGAWGQVCLPLFAMAVLVGSAPAHPRTPGKKLFPSPYIPPSSCIFLFVPI